MSAPAPCGMGTGRYYLFRVVCPSSSTFSYENGNFWTVEIKLSPLGVYKHAAELGRFDKLLRVTSAARYTSCIAVRAGYELRESGSLRIRSASMKDSGIYVCVAQNSAGTAMAQVRLQVQGQSVSSRSDECQGRRIIQRHFPIISCLSVELWLLLRFTIASQRRGMTCVYVEL